MKILGFLFVFLTLSLHNPGSAMAGLFGDNKLDDQFTVKSIDGKQATAEGEVKALKVGDYLYFTRSPYRFQIAEIKGKQVIVSLPEKHDLAAGQNLLRNITSPIKKALDTEQRLKAALDE